MEFMNRGVRNAQTTDQASSPAVAQAASKKGRFSKGVGGGSNLGKAGNMGFLLLIVTLFVLAIFSMVMFKGGNTGEGKLVDKTKFQAVFLNGGQVYFGKVNELNSKFVDMRDIYYLRVNQQVQPNANTSNSNDISLVKLGCELHGPEDQMTINREQVVFWENLKNDGQVAKAIEQYRQQFPTGQKCEDQAQNNQSSDATNSGSNTTTTPTTNTNTTTTGNTNTQNNNTPNNR